MFHPQEHSKLEQLQIPTLSGKRGPRNLKGLKGLRHSEDASGQSQVEAEMASGSGPRTSRTSSEDTKTWFVSECTLPTPKGRFRLRAYKHEGKGRSFEPVVMVAVSKFSVLAKVRYKAKTVAVRRRHPNPTAGWIMSGLHAESFSRRVSREDSCRGEFRGRRIRIPIALSLLLLVPETENS